MISTILKTQTSSPKSNNYTSPTSNQDAIVTRVRSKSFEQANIAPSTLKPQRSHSLSDLEALSAASKKCTHLLITSPTSNTDESCVEKISHAEFKKNYKPDTKPWGFSHCTLCSGSFYHCFITPTKAIKIRKEKTRPSDYHRGLEIKKIAAEKTSSSNLAISLSPKKIHSLDQRSFYLYNYRSCLKIHKVNDLSHTEEALLENCNELKFSSKEELLDFCAYTFHQLDALHKAGIYHMDMKPDNICKNKNNSFTVIDLNDSLNFFDEKVLDRIQNTDYTTCTMMIPRSFIDMLTASENPEKAQMLSRSCDLFATGSTIYQIAYAFSQGLSLTDFKKKPKPFYPYSFSIDGHPSSLKDNDKLEKTLKIFNTRQKELIKKMMSFDPNETPTSKDLKEAFPILFIKKFTYKQASIEETPNLPEKTLYERLLSLCWETSKED